jgi:UDP-N-acetylglucosamine 2-epimerase (non-hydrolysing)
VIKLAPVIRELDRRHIPFRTLFSGQHRELFLDVAGLVPAPDFRLDIMSRNQSLHQISERMFAALPAIFAKVRPSLFVVQGDTTTGASGALAAVYQGVAVGHVEAGLRTYDLNHPYPEEINRQVIARLARFNWAPTVTAARNLRTEKARHVRVTGNTIVDICQAYPCKREYGDTVLITLHRRESFGAPLTRLAKQLNRLARAHPAFRFLFPMHPNPNVQAMRTHLSKVSVVAPLPYPGFLEVLARSRCVITDSGGIQEECATFRKKVLLCRQTTERPEGVRAGFVRLVGDEVESHFKWATEDPVWRGANPYGDGKASLRIVDDIQRFLGKGDSSL